MKTLILSILALLYVTAFLEAGQSAPIRPAKPYDSVEGMNWFRKKNIREGRENVFLIQERLGK